MPGKGCYTCRRRRIICDNRLPTCQKCENAKKECLGYQKPLVWVKGVASRGKMVGRDMGDVMGKGDDDNTDGDLQSLTVRQRDFSDRAPSIFETQAYASTPRNLVDPLFNDFPWLSRSYMFHCKRPFFLGFSFWLAHWHTDLSFVQSVNTWLASLLYIPM